MSTLQALLGDWLGAAWPGLAVAFLGLLGWLGLRRRQPPAPAPRPEPIDPKLREAAEAEIHTDLAKAQAQARARAQEALAKPKTAQEAIDDLASDLADFDENDAP